VPEIRATARIALVPRHFRTARSRSAVTPPSAAEWWPGSGSAGAAIVERAVAYARRALPAWRGRPYEERAAIIEALIPILEERREEIAALVAYELDQIEAGIVFVNHLGGATTGVARQPDHDGLEGQRNHREGRLRAVLPAAVRPRAEPHHLLITPVEAKKVIDTCVW
jgi:hypothetical protein